jgi:uncharacterized cupredoxin-like copper-binding protein
MQRIVLIFLSILILRLGSACGPASQAAGTPAMTVSAPTAAAPATTGPAPAVASPAPTESAPTTGNSTEVEITLDDNTISSSLTTFQAGAPYSFVITNTGAHEHNFNIAEPVAVTGSLNASLEQALLAMAKDELPIGDTVTVEFTFPESAVGMQLEFSCLIRRHYDDNMRLAITVTP